MADGSRKSPKVLDKLLFWPDDGATGEVKAAPVWVIA